LFNPVVLRFKLRAGEAASIVASTEPYDISEVPALEASERKRRANVVSRAAVNDDFVRTLTLAADQYIVRRDNGYSVIAGYPWFTDWGRDTMIALPGLTLATGQYDVARDILATFAQHVSEGMLPNRFPDGDAQPEYNTVDATLWYFEAVRAYVAHTGDFTFVRELYPILSGMIEWHVRGTRYGIKMLDTGLLRAGAPGVQLTWMDSKIDDWVVTPRSGCPVEIQALWFNALKTIESLARRLGMIDDAQRFGGIATHTQRSFQRLFWNEKRECLYDVVNGVTDDTLRPNQVIAASLHYPLLTGERARRVLAAIARELLTAVGLRTLERREPKYAGHYGGSPQERDAVYHQGTVWPWLLGQFASAYVKAHEYTSESRERAHEMLSGLRPHLSQAGLGHISEIFDGDAPHDPHGCFAQAWSVSEILRAATESAAPAAASATSVA
jgi:predicted glycogen debranching enzyme